MSIFSNEVNKNLNEEIEVHYEKADLFDFYLTAVRFSC